MRRRAGLSRRELLAAAGAAPLLPLSAFAQSLGDSNGDGDPNPGGAGARKQSATSRPTAPLKLPRPWWMDAGATSRVIQLGAKAVLKGSTVDRVQLRALLAAGIRRLTDEVVLEKAWRTILGSARKIAIKFNSVGAAALPGNDEFGRVLVELLADADYAPENVVLIEASSFLTTEMGLAAAGAGWDDPIDVSGRRVDLARWFLDADAVINVPFLKTHRIAGLSGCMKNLSHAIVRNPALFHADHCSPAVAEIIGQKSVSNRIRLHIVNALRMVVRNGPEVAPEDVADGGTILVGRDPVAVDRVGLDLLVNERRRSGLETPIEVPYLTAAADSGLGRTGSREIERIVLG